MKWFDNWFKKQSEKAWASASRKGSYPTNSISVDDSVIDYRTSYNIKMQKAVGGTVMEISKYNCVNDEWIKDLFVIPEDKEFSSELTSILMQYKLKHD